MKVLKILVAVAALSAVSFAGNAVIPTLGLNMSNISASGDYEDFYEEAGILIGFNVGANYHLAINDQMGLLAGLSFETRGTAMTMDMITAYDASFQPITEEVDVVMSANYIQIPVLFQYNVMPELGIVVGPEAGIFLSGKAKIDDEEDDLEDINTLDLGLSFGANYTVAEKFVIGASYYLGLMNIDGSDSSDDADGAMKNTNIKLSVGYKMPM
ncbi:MAG: porin family protein [Fibrobacterota bacterium]